MKEPMIQIVCSDVGLLRKYRAEMERSGESYQVRLALSSGEAHRRFRQAEPSVILLDESAAPTAGQKGALESAAGQLSEAAPVVVVAKARWQAELAFLIASGAVDFVSRNGSFISLAAERIGRRVRMADYAAAGLFPEGEPASDFGEILRHEVNNPLTGILGNAELLLARRDRLPPAAIERVETIAELAVRLRETVRRLSHAWDGRQDDPVRLA